MILAQNAHRPDIGPSGSGSNPKGTKVSEREGVEYVKFLVPDSVYTDMNQLDGLGDKLKTYLEQALEEISNARFDIAEEFGETPI